MLVLPVLCNEINIQKCFDVLYAFRDLNFILLISSNITFILLMTFMEFYN
jgi:hypothetical protein